MATVDVIAAQHVVRENMAGAGRSRVEQAVARFLNDLVNLYGQEFSAERAAIALEDLAGTATETAARLREVMEAFSGGVVNSPFQLSAHE